MTTKEKIGAVIIVIMMIIVMFFVGQYAMNQQEIIDCERFAQWNQEYRLFHVDEAMREECSSVGVDIPIRIETPDGDIHIPEYEEIKANIYAYNSVTSQTDNDPYTNASGHRAGDGSIACPDRYEFGTKVEYDGKIYTCDDRMNQRYRSGNNFDIWMANRDDAIRFGVKKNQLIKIYK